MFEGQYQNIKRVGDVLGASFGLIATLPITLPVAALLFVQNKGDVFFSQERVGLNQQPFMAYKFKTMINPTDGQGNIIPEEKRVTKFGSFLRKHSIDELPQLWNILKNDMSVVGPRPLPENILALRSSKTQNGQNYYFRQRQSVKGGLCCEYEIKCSRMSGVALEKEYNTNYIEFIQNKEKTIPQKICYELGLIAQAARLAVKGRPHTNVFEQ